MTRTRSPPPSHCVSPRRRCSAQGTHFTVSTPSASVYKAPTNVSPVIGQATQGATLEVTRDVGSWVKVAWSQAPDGVGYVRKSAGTMGALGPAVPAAPAATPAAAPRASSRAAAAASASAPRRRRRPARPCGHSRRLPAGYVAPSHRFGVGGQIGGSAMGAGFSVRGWSKSQQPRRPVRRHALLDDERRVLHADVVHAVRTARAVCVPRSRVGSHLAAALRRRRARTSCARRSPIRPTALAMSDTRMAAQFFGGTEVTLSAVPRLGLSADVGYQWYQSPFVGYTLDGMMLTLSAHWYSVS